MTEVVLRLPESAQSFVDEQVATGQFATASDFLLSLIEAARKRATVERVDQMLLEGLASGPGEEATGAWWATTKEEWKRTRPEAN